MPYSEEQKNDKPYVIGEESENTEFKKTTGELREGIISIAAILNKHGKGTLYFGVKNDGTVIGQVVSDETLRAVSQAVGNHITPTVYPEITKITINGRDIIQVRFSGTQKPYLAYNIPRIRVADEDLVMEQPIYDAMLRKRSDTTFSWEKQVSKYTVHDIDKNVFNDYIRRARKAKRISFKDEDAVAVLSRLGLTDGGKLLNAGAALFVDSGMNELQMAKFASDRRLTFTDIRRHTGSILVLIELAVNYVIDAMDWKVEFNGRLQRDEIPEIPVNAVREAVTNAFAHRSIESGQSVEVAVYRSFIDIYSPGKFPDRLTPEMFITEAIPPVRRNPLITRTLYYSKDMESFATGLKRIQDACNEVGCIVEYKTTEYGFTVRFHRHCGSGWSQYITDSTEMAPPEEPIIVPQTVEVGTRKGEVGTRKDEVGTRKDEVGTRKDEFGTHEGEFGTHEGEFGTHEGESGTHEGESGTHEGEFGTHEGEFGTHEGESGTHDGEFGTHAKTEVNVSKSKETDHNSYNTQIIQMIRENNKVSRKEMANKLSISERTIQRILKTIPQVRYAGSGNNGHWELVEKE